MSDSLKVNTETLTEYGNYLKSSVTTLDAKLGALDTNNSSVTNSWLDEVGTMYKDKFSSFINDAKKINVEIEKLANYALDISSRYETILQDHYSRME